MKRYKLVLSGTGLYREFQLPPEASAIRLGTGAQCELRLHKEQFFEQVELHLACENGQWTLTCADNLFFTLGDMSKRVTGSLSHGDSLQICYRNSGAEVMRLAFMLDFDYQQQSYDRLVELPANGSITLGGAEGCNIRLGGELVAGDMVRLYWAGGWRLEATRSRYGVYLNGVQVAAPFALKKYDFFSLADYSFYIKGNRLYTSMRGDLTVNGLQSHHIKQQSTALEYPRFNRGTRLHRKLADDAIEVLDPPPLPQKPKSNIVLQLLPALAMVAITVLVRGSMGGNSSFIIFSVCTTAVGIVTSVLGIMNDKKTYKKDLEQRESEYKAYINSKRTAVEAARVQERTSLTLVHPPLEKLLEDVWAYSGSLFEKSPEDEDFATVRLGEGSVESRRAIQYKKQERFATDDALQDIPRQLGEEFRTLSGAPVILPLAGANAVGVVGAPQPNDSLLKTMVLELSIRHYYRELQLVLLVSPQQAASYTWLRWLPHFNNDSLGRGIVCDDDSRNAFLEYLYMELGAREANGAAGRPHIVLLVLDDYGLKTHPVGRYIPYAASLGASFVYFEQYAEHLPQGCSALISMQDAENGTLVYSGDCSRSYAFRHKPVEDTVALRAALRLAPVVCDEVSLEGELTRSITLYSLLNILSADDLQLAERWQQSAIHKSMAAPLGVKRKGEVVCLDLHEKAHGPHGLVAGTTGSGKSEILQSYILSMATMFHPYEVGFVIIDFKGGGMVNQFARLPHLVGSITNIDGREIDRSLLSIKAELQKRQRLFAQQGVNHIDAYIRCFKEGKTAVPLPHLILIVDEFAELKADQPEFMKELISAARIGRSLGVHLILATQKPSGVVDDQIWSNSRFRLCLKVQNREDSNEVLKSPLAAEIKEPGRAYLQVGNNEIFDLFQSAYSGAPSRTDGNKKRYTLREVSLSGKRTEVYSHKPEADGDANVTQLQALVDHVARHCEAEGIARLPGICLPPLEDCIGYQPATKTEDSALQVPLGIYDDPANQLQQAAFLPLTTANTFVIGSSQYGKTNLLQTLLRGIGDGYSPADVNVYILDFASMLLKNFEALPHVGGVVLSTEDEKLKNLMKLLATELARRKEALAAQGLSSFASYREAGLREIPQIVLMVDNFAAFRELYPQYDEELLTLCREGLAVGISLVITSSQTAGFGYRILSNFSGRIALYCNDSGEYSNLFERCRMRPKNTPGRGLLEQDKQIYEYQTYLCFDGEKEIDRVRQAQSYAKGVAERCTERALPIPEVPARLTEEQLWSLCGELPPYTVPLGIDYDAVEPVTLDLASAGVFLLSGQEKDGRVPLLCQLMERLQHSVLRQPVNVFVLDNNRRPLAALNNFGCVKRYSVDPSEIEDMVEQLHDALQSRYESLAADEEAMGREPLLVLLVHSRDALDFAAESKEATAALKSIATRLRGMKGCVLFTDVENAQAGYSAPELKKYLREQRRGLVFEDMRAIRVYETGSLERIHKKPLSAGDAYLFCGEEVLRIKTPESTL